MSVNASQLELNQLIHRHLKEHGFLSAAEELQRHSPQGESKSSVSLLDIYKSWLKNPKKKRKSEKCSKSGKKSPSKGKSASPARKMDKPAKTSASPKKSVSAKRKKSDEKPSQSVKAKKSKPNTTENATSDGSDSDSSLDLEKWKKLSHQMTEADFAKMEAINELTSESQPKKKRSRKPPAKPLSKADAPVQQNGETIGQNEQDEEKVGTQTPTKKNAAKRSKKESPSPVSSPSKQSPNKRVKSVEDEQASSGLPEKFEKQTHLQEMLIPVNANEEMASETKIKKKKKKAKEENEDKTEGSANETNSDGKDKKRKRREITEQEDDDGQTEGEKRIAKEGKMEEGGSDNENFSELSVQEKKAKKKKKDKSSSEEGLAQIDEKKKTMVVGEENFKQPDKKIKPGTPKPKKKENNNMKGNLDHINEAEEESGEQNIEEIENSKKMVTKEKTSSEKYLAEMHKKKEKKKKVLNNEGYSELLDLKANPEQIISIDEAGGNKKCEQSDQGKKAKKKKDKSVTEKNLEHETMAAEENVEDKYNSEQMVGEKKSKKKKRESLGCKEFPEEVALEKKAKKKNQKSDENDLVEEEKPKDDDDHTNNKSTLETDEGSLEIASPLKKKKKKNKLKSDEAPEEADISTQNSSTTQPNSADVHRKKKKSKRTES